MQNSQEIKAKQDQDDEDAYDQEQFDNQAEDQNRVQDEDNDDEEEEEDAEDDEDNEAEESPDRKFTTSTKAATNNFYPYQMANTEVVTHPGQNQAQLIQGRLRPQSAKALEQQQNNQPWLSAAYPQEHNNMQQVIYQQQHPVAQSLYGGNFAPYQQSLLNSKRRPFTGGNNKRFQVRNSKTSNNIEIEVSRIRPTKSNHFKVDREKLFDDVIRQKMTSNFLKDENIRQRTKIQVLENELFKKDKVIENLMFQQESYQLGGMGGPIILQSSSKQTKFRQESHLTLNLKRKIREQQFELAQKQEELDVLKQNLRSTKLTEIEVELKTYLDECTRLRSQLEDVIKSKDTFADPEEMQAIQVKFQEQDMANNQLRVENTEIAKAYQQKEEENLQLREMINELDKKIKVLKANQVKETAKIKKTLKERERELKSMRDQYLVQKMQNEESSKSKAEEPANKKIQNFVSNKPSVHGSSYIAASNNHNTNQNNDQEVKKLKATVDTKESKIKELNGVVSQLQQKLQEKLNEVSKEQFEKNKFKGLYEQYQNQVVQLEAQLEDVREAGDRKPAQKKEPQLSQPKSHDAFPPNPKQNLVAKVEAKQLEVVALELKLKLLVKGFKQQSLKDFFFKPYQENSDISVKDLAEIFDSNGIQEKPAQLLARFLIEAHSPGKQVVFNENLSANQSQVVQQLKALIGPYKVYSEQTLVKECQQKLKKAFEMCRETLKETFLAEDYEETGVLSYPQIQSCFETLDIELDQDSLDYMLLVLYQKSESIEKLKYSLIFEIIEGALLQGNASQESQGQNRKRPESSSPKKLMARNKQKFQDIEKVKSDNQDDNADDDEYNEYDQDIGDFLDKDDDDVEDDENKPSPFSKAPIVDKKKAQVEVKEGDDEEDDQNYEDEKFSNQDDQTSQNQQKDQEEQNQKQQEEDEDQANGGVVAEGDEGEEEYIDQDKMLDVAENCFIKIAEAVLKQGLTIRKAFKHFIIKEEFEDQYIELLSPIGLLEGIKDLGIPEFEDLEVACLMRILAKPDLDNAILLQELIVIMENFGIQDDLEQDQSNKDDEEDQPNTEPQNISGAFQQEQSNSNQNSKKKKKKKKDAGVAQLDEQSYSLLQKLMFSLIESGQSPQDYFSPYIFNQNVKTKTKLTAVEIIKAQDFITCLQKNLVIDPKDDEEEEVSLPEALQNMLCLDKQSYPYLLVIKKLAKALDEIAGIEQQRQMED